MSGDVTAVMIELGERNGSVIDGMVAVELLRTIVAAHHLFMDRNENGSHDEFQRAANAFHDSVDAAEAWLVTRGLATIGGGPAVIPLPAKGGE